jgi:hypothetical protein
MPNSVSMSGASQIGLGPFFFGPLAGDDAGV